MGEWKAFNHKTFRRVSMKPLSKREAKSEARRQRKMGRLARVVLEEGEYFVFMRPRSGFRISRQLTT